MFIVHQYNAIVSWDYRITPRDAVLQGSPSRFIYPLFIKMDWDGVWEQRDLCMHEKIKNAKVNIKHENMTKQVDVS